MLQHGLPAPSAPTRAVVLGSGGFVGGAAVAALGAARVPTLGLARSDLDLVGSSAGERLSGLLRPDDALIFISARAPCKDAAMLVENIRMAEAVCAALKARPPAHLLYVSSDAVYRDAREPLTEDSCAEPGSPHGAMHLAREVLLRSAFSGPMAVLRPTLVYGANDPHNGYGPNRFRRLAAAGKEIVLFGEGEERRDHVSVDDVGELIARIVLHRSAGVLNAVSGQVASFRELAEFIAGQHHVRVAIKGSPRTGPMPHGGYRSFDAAGITRAFPDFRPKTWREGLAALCRSAAP